MLRDLLVFSMVMLSLPLAFKRPFLGMLVFSWLAYMRPQDLCWGFAREMRFSFYVALAMLLGWFAHETRQRRFLRMDSFVLAATTDTGLSPAARRAPAGMRPS